MFGDRKNADTLISVRNAAVRNLEASRTRRVTAVDLPAD